MAPPTADTGRTTARFEKLDRQGRIDLTSGAWDFGTNQRKAHCGKCGKGIAAGEGRPYNEFMADYYRASTHYLCPECASPNDSSETS